MLSSWNHSNLFAFLISCRILNSCCALYWLLLLFFLSYSTVTYLLTYLERCHFACYGFNWLVCLFPLIGPPLSYLFFTFESEWVPSGSGLCFEGSISPWCSSPLHTSMHSHAFFLLRPNYIYPDCDMRLLIWLLCATTCEWNLHHSILTYVVASSRPYVLQWVTMFASSGQVISFTRISCTHQSFCSPGFLKLSLGDLRVSQYICICCLSVHWIPHAEKYEPVYQLSGSAWWLQLDLLIAIHIYQCLGCSLLFYQHSCICSLIMHSVIFAALLLLYDVTNKASFDNIRVSRHIAWWNTCCPPVEFTWRRSDWYLFLNRHGWQKLMSMLRMMWLLCCLATNLTWHQNAWFGVKMVRD